MTVLLDTPSRLAAPTNNGGRKAVIAGTIGHILEWYDFAVYGYVAIHIAANFFPSEDKTASLLASLAAFGVGFAARPIGGILFGRIGDKRGRRAVLLTTLLLMAVSTLMIGLLPTYETIGVAAPLLLVLARLLQGFSAGGETTTAAAFIVEWAPNGRRGLYGSFQQMGSGAGLLLGSLTVAAITTALPADAMSQWGWRIPFLIGGMLAPIAFVIRRAADETPKFTTLSEANAVTANEQDSGKTMGRVLQAFLFSLFWSVGFYFFLSYMPTYAIRELKLAGTTVFWLSSAASLIYIAAIPLSGAASDAIGRKTTLLISCGIFALASVPAFIFLNKHPTPMNYFIIITLVGILFSMYTGPAAATLSEIFPTRSRSSGMAIGYNLSTVVFGGFTPFISTWLIAAFATPLAPIYYVVACAVVGGLFIVTLEETARKPLR